MNPTYRPTRWVVNGFVHDFSSPAHTPNTLAFTVGPLVCEDEAMNSDYTPDDHAARVFARFKRHYEAQKRLLPDVKELAAHALRQGATTGQLARLTGLTDELFRRIARAHGIERRRPPTVGREVEQHAPADTE